MKKLILLFLIIVSCSEKSDKNKDIKSEIDFTTIFEKSKGLETATYNQTIKYYITNLVKYLNFLF